MNTNEPQPGTWFRKTFDGQSTLVQVTKEPSIETGEFELFWRELNLSWEPKTGWVHDDSRFTAYWPVSMEIIYAADAMYKEMTEIAQERSLAEYRVAVEKVVNP